MGFTLLNYAYKQHIALYKLNIEQGRVTSLQT